MNSTPSTPEKKGHESKKWTKKKLTLFGAFYIFVFIVIFFGIWTFGLYRLRWNDPYTRKMVIVLPFPAMIVDRNAVSMDDFYKQLDIFTFFTDNLMALAPAGTQDISEADKQQAIISKITKDQIVKLLLVKYGVTVTTEEINNRFTDIFGVERDQVTAEQLVQDAYGTNVNDFLTYFVEPLVRQQKLQEYFVNSEFHKEVKDRADKLRADIAAGTVSFVDAARKESDHSSAADGGDLGFFARGERLPLLEEAVFALQIGEMSPVLDTETGYHLVLMEDRKEVEVEGERKEQVRVRYIFLEKESVEGLIDKTREETRIYNFVD